MRRYLFTLPLLLITGAFLLGAFLLHVPFSSAAETELTITRALLSTPIGRSDVKPGDSLNLATRLESDGDEALQDIELSVVFRETSGALLRDEQGDIINLTSDINVLRKGESIDRTLRIRIPYTVSDGEQYTAELTARGYRINRTTITARHDRTTFTIDKLPHELLFPFLSLSRDTAACGDTLTLSYAIRNIGNANEDAMLTIRQSELVVSHEVPFTISKDYDKNNTYSGEINLRIPRVPSGTYPILVHLQYREFTVDQELPLDVRCADVQRPLTPTPETPVVTPPSPITPVAPTAPAAPPPQVEPTPIPVNPTTPLAIPESYRIGVVLVAVLGGVVVLVILILVVIRLRKIKRIMG